MSDNIYCLWIEPDKCISLESTISLKPDDQENLMYCGESFFDAWENCLVRTPCPNGREECPSGQTCYASILCNTEEPTTSPERALSPTPSWLPSSQPSFFRTSSVKREFKQYLRISNTEEFTDVQVGIYELLMKSYTANFGAGVTDPKIVTKCEVLGQVSSADDRTNLLVISFTLQYESRYGYDISDYPSLFANYVNFSLDIVTRDMGERFLPVIEAMTVIAIMPEEPTVGAE